MVDLNSFSSPVASRVRRVVIVTKVHSMSRSVITLDIGGKKT